jgi:Ca2+:H+ antiporter
MSTDRGGPPLREEVGHWRRRPRATISARGVSFSATALLTILALLSRAAGLPAPFVFVLAACAMALLAWTIGIATEQLACVTGPKVGGVLNATFGNIAEIIITFFALRAGLTTVVKASITGSILGNTLLVLGLSILLGGLRHGELRFSRTMASLNASLLMIAVVGLAVPAVFARSLPVGQTGPVDRLSVGVALILLVAYFLSLVFFFRTPTAGGAERTRVAAQWPMSRSILVLALTAGSIAILSDVLVDAIRPTLSSLGLSEIFAGIVIIPLIGNLSENVVGVQLALQNDMDFSMVISLGASLQVALFVAPLLVFLSLVVGRPMDLVFTPLELVTVGFGALIMALIANDGESNWLEGAELVAVYAIVALAFFFYPG